MHQEYKERISFFFSNNMDTIKKNMHNVKQLEYYYKHKKQLKYYYENKEKRLKYMQEYRLKQKGNKNNSSKSSLKFSIQFGKFMVYFD